MGQAAKIRLHFRGAKRVGHSTVRENTCCGAVCELLTRALALNVEKTTSNSRHGLEEAGELVW